MMLQMFQRREAAAQVNQPALTFPPLRGGPLPLPEGEGTQPRPSNPRPLGEGGEAQPSLVRVRWFANPGITLRAWALYRQLVRHVALLGLAALTALALPAQAAERFITVASTTSTEASGLFKQLLPAFTEASGIEARVVAVGTGQAIKLARSCDADVLFVHHKPSEEAFVAEGYGVARHDVMYNDFVIVGPANDPAGLKGEQDAVKALKATAAAEAPFASRGDDSGTHKKERALWGEAGIDVAAASGRWYRETGSGMGATLNTAAAMGAYALTDRGTWLAFKNKAGMAVLAEGDPRLFNQYGVVLVSATKCPSVKSALGQVFVDWLIGPEGQAAIAAFKLGGQQLFFPNAGSGGS